MRDRRPPDRFTEWVDSKTAGLGRLAEDLMMLALFAITFAPAVVLAVAAVAVAAYQVFAYLRTSFFPSPSMLDAFIYFDNKWASRPDSWFGLHEVFAHLPLSAGLLLASSAYCGLLILLWLISNLGEP